MRMEPNAVEDVVATPPSSQLDAALTGLGVSALQRALDSTLDAQRFSMDALDGILEQLPALVFVKRASDLRFERLNGAFTSLLGISREAAIGKGDHDFFPSEQADFFHRVDREVLSGGTLVDIPEEPVDTPLGRRWLRTTKIPLRDGEGVVRHLLGISLDITEQKLAEQTLESARAQLEARIAECTYELELRQRELARAELELVRAQEELRREQKMEAIGRLAAGVAHDFNDLLTVIGGFSDLALGQLSARSPVRGFVEQIERATQRARALTQQLLAFGRRQVLRPQTLDLDQLVRDLRATLEALAGDRIKLDVRARARAEVRVDRAQIEQLIHNLVANAREAMPTGGTLVIETEQVCARESPLLDGARQPTDAVRLRVSDDGVGMDSATMAQIFEPFFTTKPIGRGAGLGLSTAFGIARQSGGTISVQSEPGRGTCLSVYLPSAAAQPASMPRLQDHFSGGT